MNNIIQTYQKVFSCLTFLIIFAVYETIHADENKITIPMDLSLNRPVINILINQKGPYKFIFDTGASGNVIDKNIASSLALKETGKIEIGAPGSNNTSLASQVNVPEIEISGQSFPNTSMVVMNLRAMIPVDGIISFKEFSEFLITIDYPGKQIILAKGNLPEDQKNVISLVPDSKILTVPIKANGRMWQAHLDTGSPFSFAFPFALKEQLRFKSPPVLLPGRSRTVAGTHQNWRAELDGKIELADIIYNYPKIILSERHNEFVNIGHQLLKDLSITIDQQNGLAQFNKNEPENVVGEKVGESESSEITGRYGGIRSITLENGIYYIQRDGSIKLKLVEVGVNLYEGKLPKGMRAMNTLPKIRFEKDSSGKVSGLTFIYEDGKEEFVKKDDIPKKR